MDYSPTLCFVGFNSKMRKSQQERREKEKLHQFMLRQSSMCREKGPSKWLWKFVTIIFLLSQHKGLNIEDELCRDKRKCVTKEHGKNITS